MWGWEKKKGGRACVSINYRVGLLLSTLQSVIQSIQFLALDILFELSGGSE